MTTTHYQQAAVAQAARLLEAPYRVEPHQSPPTFTVHLFLTDFLIIDHAIIILFPSTQQERQSQPLLASDYAIQTRERLTFRICHSPRNLADAIRETVRNAELS